MKKTIGYMLLFGLLILAGRSHYTRAQDLFKMRRDSLLPNTVLGDIGWGDYDSDGDLDAALVGVDSVGAPVTGVYKNNGDALMRGGNRDDGFVSVSFYDLAFFPKPVSQSALEWTDYDNDGDLDVVVMGVTKNGKQTTIVYKYNLNTFLSRDFNLPGLREGDVESGDYDNDGDLDFLLTGFDASDTPATRLCEQLSNRFSCRNRGLVQVGYSSAEWGDYDGDGDLDLVITGVTNNPQNFITRVYRNDDGDFQQAASLQGMLYGSVDWGDYDDDGDLDLALNGARLSPFLAEGVTQIYRNDNGTFQPIDAALAGQYQGSVAWGDYDGDGDLDLLSTGSQRPLGTVVAWKLYRNDGADQFSTATTYGGGAYGSARWGDYDDDGDLDLLFTGEETLGNAETTVLENLQSTNTSPTAPSALQADVSDAGVTLSWQAGSDAQTPARGLSYNLRVGARSGGSSIKTPMAVASTGRRLLPERGNAGATTSWTLRNLPAGTYYWSVQAIDHCFKGSPFAPEGSFTVP